MLNHIVLTGMVSIVAFGQQPSPLGEPVNAQSGTSYSVAATDCGKHITFNNASAVAVTLPQSSSAFFPSGCWVDMQNYGAGTVTVTPTTSTINNGGSTLTIATNQGVKIVSDASNNYQVQTGKGSGGTVTTFTISGTGNQITVTGTCTITTTGTCTLSIPNAFVAPGSVTATTTFVNAVNTVASGASPAFDLSLGNVQTITALAVNATATFSNIAAGKTYYFLLCQDATGGRTFTWPATALGAMTMGGTASKCSSQSFYSNGTNLYALGPGIINM